MPSYPGLLTLNINMCRNKMTQELTYTLAYSCLIITLVLAGRRLCWYKIIRNTIFHENCGRMTILPKLSSSGLEAYIWCAKESSSGNTTFLPNK